MSLCFWFLHYRTFSYYINFKESEPKLVITVMVCFSFSCLILKVSRALVFSALYFLFLFSNFFFFVPCFTCVSSILQLIILTCVPLPSCLNSPCLPLSVPGCRSTCRIYAFGLHVTPCWLVSSPFQVCLISTLINSFCFILLLKYFFVPPQLGLCPLLGPASNNYTLKWLLHNTSSNLDLKQTILTTDHLCPFPTVFILCNYVLHPIGQYVIYSGLGLGCFRWPWISCSRLSMDSARSWFGISWLASKAVLQNPSAWHTSSSGNGHNSCGC